MLMGIERLFRKMHCGDIDFHFVMDRCIVFSGCPHDYQQSERQSDSFYDSTFNTVAIETL
jgi:hypothetical protein